MCGIAGVYGNNAIRLSLLITLGQLERGTLGTGVAYLLNNRIKFLKEPIHPIRFVKKYYHRFDSNVKIAISHNRQPSKGNVSYYNTHPFLECGYRFALIHNGSVVVDDALVRMLKREHYILGETDSEIITHLIEHFYDETGDLVEAINKIMELGVSGAFLILHKNGKIYGFRKGVNPLHYATTSKHVLLGSEEEAIQNIIDDKVDIVSVKSKQIIIVKQNNNVEVIGKGEEIYENAYYYYNPYYSFRSRYDNIWSDFYGF